MLLPRNLNPAAIAAARAQLVETGVVRIAPAFAEARATAYHTALRGSEHRPSQRVDAHAGWQLWRLGFVPGHGCEHPLCELGRWLRGDALAWASAVTGLTLAAEPDPILFSDRAQKSAFRDAYDAGAEGRVIAFQVQLAPAAWPIAWGGHLELLAGANGAPVQRLGPAWNALDLHDVRAPRGWRRLPMIERHVAGFVVSGGYREAP